MHPCIKWTSMLQLSRMIVAMPHVSQHCWRTWFPQYIDYPWSWSTPWSGFFHQFSVSRALPESTQDGWGVNFPTVSQQVGLHWQVLILTSSFSFNALHYLSASGLHPVELLHLQSELHASYSSQWDTMPLHHPFPSQFCSLELQADLTTTISSVNTRNQVNGILPSLWFEVLINSLIARNLTAHAIFNLVLMQLNINPKTWIAVWELAIVGCFWFGC